MERTGFIVLEIVLLAIVSYLLLSVLVSFAKRHFTHNEETHRTRQHQLRRSLDILVILCFVVGVATFSLNVVGMLFPHLFSNCSSFGLSYHLLQASGSTMLYLFLWLRQNTLCKEPVLQPLVSSFHIWFSRSVLFAIILTSAIGIPGLIFTLDESLYIKENKTDICYHALGNHPTVFLVYSAHVVIILLQGSLLFLFVHILKRYVSQLSTILGCNNRDSSERIKALVRNCCIAAFVASFVDLAMVISDVAGAREIVSQKEFYILWDINYAINVACILFCFANWHEMIWPWKKLAKKSERTPVQDS